MILITTLVCTVLQVACFIAADSTTPIKDHITIKTSLGLVKGNVINSKSNNDKDNPSTIYEFLGIRYGVPPTGDLRFRPTTVNSHKYEDTYDGTTYGPACYQLNAIEHSITEMSEDCLYLNIWTPYNLSQPISDVSSLSVDLYPVMLFIHGGAFVNGAGSLSLYASDGIASRGQNVVAITINYRLGALGFFASQELYQENMKYNNYPSYGGLNGIYDQIIAINWVKKYISSFGGNPNDITIYGESAGGLSACMLYLTPLLRDDMINKVIIESGACNGPWGPFSKEAGLLLIDNRCNEANIPNNLTYLRELEPLVLLEKLKTTADSWGVSVDNWILTDEPRNSITKLNNVSDVNTDKIMIGFNSMDGLMGWPYFAGPHPNTSTQLYSMIETYISNTTQANLLYNYYYPLSDFLNASIVWYTMNADVCVICPSLILMETIDTNINDNNNNDNSDTNMIDEFVYYFRSAASPYLAGHASELPFVFDKEYDVSEWSEQWDTNLSYSMMSAWTNMAKNGKPNITNQWTNVYLDWPSFNYKKSENVVILDDNIRVENDFTTNYRNNVCHFWWNQVDFNTVKNLCRNNKS